MNNFELMQFQAFQEEARELAAELETSLLALEQDPGDSELVARVFRAMHTIKGSSAMCGLDDIATLAHHAEDLLDRARSGRIEITRRLIDLILSVNDQLRCMVEAKGDSAAADSATTAMLIDWLAHFDEAARTGGEPMAKPVKPATPASRPKHAGHLRCLRIRLVPNPTIWRTGTRLNILLKELRALGNAVVRVDPRGVPALDELDPTLCFLHWEVVLLTRADDRTVEDVFMFVKDTCRVDIQEYDPTDTSEFTCDLMMAPARMGEEAARTEAPAPRTAAAPGAPQAVAPTARPAGGAGRPRAAQRGSASGATAGSGQLAELFASLVSVQVRIQQAAAAHTDSMPELHRLTDEMMRLTAAVRERFLEREPDLPLQDRQQASDPGPLRS